MFLNSSLFILDLLLPFPYHLTLEATAEGCDCSLPPPCMSPKKTGHLTAALPPAQHFSDLVFQKEGHQGRSIQAGPALPVVAQSSALLLCWGYYMLDAQGGGWLFCQLDGLQTLKYRASCFFSPGLLSSGRGFLRLRSVQVCVHC